MVRPMLPVPPATATIAMIVYRVGEFGGRDDQVIKLPCATKVRFVTEVVLEYSSKEEEVFEILIVSKD